MALIKCPRCEKDVSDKATKCPNCGTDLTIKKTEDNKKSSNLLKIVIGILIIVIVVMAWFILSLLEGNKKKNEDNGNIGKRETEITEEIDVNEQYKSKNKEENGIAFQVDKTIYEDEYATIVCDSITNKSIIFKVTSKMENRKFSILFHNVALDGLGVDFHNYQNCEIQPGETVEYIMEGELNNSEHKLMSLVGDLFDDTGAGFVRVDICDFELGGKSNLEYEEKDGEKQFSSDNVEVRYIGASGKGLEFRVENKKNSAINIVCDSLTLNDKEQEPLYYGTITLPAHAVTSYYVDVISNNPDLLPEQIESFDGSMYTWGKGGTTEDKFEISLNKK